MEQKRSVFKFLGVCAMLLLLVSGCKEADIRLLNNVKTFSSQWSILHEKITFFSRNISLAEDRLETDYKQIEGLMDQIPDSLRGSEYRQMLKDYEQSIDLRDSLRKIFDKSRGEYKDNRAGYTDFEHKVSDGTIQKKEGFEKLDGYKSSYARLDSTLDHITNDLEGVFGTHNRVLRKLSDYMAIHSNYDIKMR